MTTTLRTNLLVNPIGPGVMTTAPWQPSRVTLAKMPGFFRCTITDTLATSTAQRIQPTAFTVTAIPGVTYTMQAEARSPSAYPMGVVLQFYDTNQTFIASAGSFIGTGLGSTEFETLPPLTALAPPGTAYVIPQVTIIGTGTRTIGDTFDVRNVILEQANYQLPGITTGNYARDPQLTIVGGSNNGASWSNMVRVADVVPPGTTHAARTSRVSIPARTNLCTNPSVETNTGDLSVYAGVGATMARVNTRAMFGTWSVQVNPVTGASGSGSMGVRHSTYSIAAGTQITASCYVYVPSSNTQTATSTMVIFRDDPANNSISVTAQAIVEDSWVRLSATYTVPAGSTITSIYFVAACASGWITGDTAFYDGFLVEQGATLGSYFDGATTDVAGHDYAWTGTAQLSTSTDTPPAGSPVAANVASPTVIGSCYIGAAGFADDKRVRVTPGTTISVGAWVRSDAASNSTLNVVYVNSAGAQVGATVVGPTVLAVPANTWAQVKVEGSVVPATADFCYPFISTLTASGSTCLVGTQTWYGKVQVNRAATLQPYGDGDTAGWGWAGAANASESFAYTTIDYFDGDTIDEVDADYAWTATRGASTSVKTLVPLHNQNFQLGATMFGIYQDVVVENFDPGSAEWRTQDADNPVRAGQMFGRDYLGGPLWAFDLFTNADSEAEALQAVATLAKEWRGASVAETPNAVLPLTYRLVDRRRRVYGRPRRWAAQPDNSRYIPITADFQTVDPLHYDEGENTRTVSIVPASTGGFITPIITPLTTLTGGYRQGFITVGGDAPTYPVIRIDGPITNPWVAANGWRYELTTSVLSGQAVVIDSRPWVLTVLRGSSSVAGSATPTSRLDKMKLTPGDTEIQFGGTDGTGTAKCSVSWRNAWYSL